MNDDTVQPISVDLVLSTNTVTNLDIQQLNDVVAYAENESNLTRHQVRELEVMVECLSRSSISPDLFSQVKATIDTLSSSAVSVEVLNQIIEPLREQVLRIQQQINDNKQLYENIAKSRTGISSVLGLADDSCVNSLSCILSKLEHQSIIDQSNLEQLLTLSANRLSLTALER